MTHLVLVITLTAAFLIVEIAVRLWTTERLCRAIRDTVGTTRSDIVDTIEAAAMARGEVVQLDTRRARRH